MCGRFALVSDHQLLLEFFGLEDIPQTAPRYNIAPTQPVAAVRESAGGGRELTHFRWGLVPSWAKDPSIGNRMINARSETASQKPSFRNAIRYRRCLVAADGFYEWKKPPGGGKAPKQPFFIGMADKSPFAFGGIWETWSDGDGGETDSCAILTTGPNSHMEGIHDRMPVIVKPEDFDIWLDTKMQDTRELSGMFAPFDAGLMRAHPVSTLVNNPRNDDPECLAEIRS